MPQEFHAVRCFNCETYQVDIVKKVPKWSCKVCGEKQSLKKIYGKGNGKECRLLVQTLNEQRLAQSTVSTPVVSKVNEDCSLMPNISKRPVTRTSKWTEFVDDDNIVSEHSVVKTVETSARTKTSSKWNSFIQQNETSVSIDKSDSLCGLLTHDGKSSIESKVSSETEIYDNIFEDDTNNLDAVFAL